MKCNYCGFEFDEQELLKSCKSCPMSKACNKMKCPNCGYQILKEPKTILLLKKWVNKIGFRSK